MALTNMTTRSRSTHTSRPASGLAGLLVCATLAVLALGVSACASTQPVGRQFDDAALTAKVKTKITADPELNPFDVDVDTIDGVVTLRGTLPTEEKVAEAVKLARYTEGVTNVENRLRVHKEASVAEHIGDAALASEIDSKLGVDPDVKATNIDVDVQDGVVTLSGIVQNSFAKEHAEKIARSVDGVRRVINDLRVS